MDLFENAVFMLSCGRVKTELFENADVTASIYDVPEHAHRSLGISQGYFDCLFSFVKVRTEEFECSNVFVWKGIFSKTLLVWTRIFFIRIKKMRLHKDTDTCGRGLRCSSKRTSNQFRYMQEMAEDDDLVNLLASLGSEESKYCIACVCHEC